MTVDRPLVSVVVPTYNCAGTIERCLRSVHAQTYPNIEIIVVDNNSDDGTAEIAAQYAQVLQAGPERSAQVNYGARHARGDYLYRIDGDFELEPGVIQACVTAIEQDDLDTLAVPNRSLGDTYWARVRALERDTYLDDPLIVAARFWKRSAFEAVGGFDESLVACEDYDLHNRLLAQGYKVGRVTPTETHLGEAPRLWDYAVQSFYYGPSILRYLKKHPRRGTCQMFPLRAAYVRHRRTLLTRPHLLLGLIVLKIVQYTAAVTGVLAMGLGLTAPPGRLVPSALVALVIVLVSLFGLVGTLSRSGVHLGLVGNTLVYGGGFILWQITGRRRARRRRVPLAPVLLDVAMPFSSLLVMSVMGAPAKVGVTHQAWPLLLGLALAIWAGWLVYLAEPQWKRWAQSAGPPVLVTVLTLIFIGVFALHGLALLRTFALGAYDLAAYDQALWTTMDGQGALSPSNIMYSSVLGHSLFINEPAPVLLLLLPAYALGLGGPALLLVSQSIAIGLAAIALYCLAADEIGRGPAVFIAAAYLLHFLTLRIGAGSFRVVNFVAPLLLFALYAYRRRRYAVYYVLMILTLACGLNASLAVAGFGLCLIFLQQERRHGLVTFGIGTVWSLTLISTWESIFGGAAGQMLAPFAPPKGTSLLTHLIRGIVRPDALRYVGSLLAPLGLLPLLGAPLLLPALPQLLLNLITGNARYVSLNGWYEFTIMPFLFVAAIRGVQRLGKLAETHRRAEPYWAGSVLILVSSVTVALFLAPDIARDFQEAKVQDHHKHGYGMLDEIPEDASVAVQSPFGVPLAHRRQVTILPRVEDADFILFDVFHPHREPQPELYPGMLQRAFLNPEYGLKSAVNGYLLFERGLDPANNLARLALVTDPQIEYPHTAELSAIVAYRGFDLSATHVRPGETFYITHYWESLAQARKPYLLLTIYPGARLLEPAVWGLFPVQDWRPGDIVRHEQAIVLPRLPDGDDYEIAVGLWYDEGEPELRAPEQLLGNDIILIATISAKEGTYQIIPWAPPAAGGDE